MDFLMYAFLILIPIALVAFVFPPFLVSFQKRHPGLFRLVLILALIVQFPVLFLGSWGLGMMHDGRTWGKIVDGSYAVLPFLYIAIFFLSLLMQGRKGRTEVSFGVAGLSSLVLSPFLHSVILNMIGNYF
ncbi:MAG: hypothetical protein Q8R78_03605 [Candidatus Omnitrophota bacterium]|nr:hypothetical protein [Candidatus Omnitrophota bacterium]